MQDSMPKYEVDKRIRSTSGMLIIITGFTIYSLIRYGYTHTYVYVLGACVLAYAGLKMLSYSVEAAIDGNYKSNFFRSIFMEFGVIYALGSLCFFLFFYKGIYQGYLMISSDFSFLSLLWRLLILFLSFHMTKDVADLQEIMTALKRTSNIHAKQ